MTTFNSLKPGDMVLISKTIRLLYFNEFEHIKDYCVDPFLYQYEDRINSINLKENMIILCLENYTGLVKDEIKIFVKCLVEDKIIWLRLEN